MSEHKSSQIIVTTVTGRKVDITKCVQVGGDYYKIGKNDVENSGDCYIIGENRTVYTANNVVFDREMGCYFKKDRSYVKGVVDITNGSDLQFGYFKSSKMRPLLHINDNTVQVMNEEILLRSPEFIDNYHIGMYTHISHSCIYNLTRKAMVTMDVKSRFNYSIVSRDLAETRSILNNFEFKGDPLNKSIPNLDAILNLIKGKSFGLEFETVSGIIPSHLLWQSSLIPLRDGSIPGLEYATGILSDESGLLALSNACTVLSDRTDTNNDCALHMHIGGIPRTKEFILALFIVMTIAQDSLYKQYPVYKRDNMGVKAKNYSAPLPVSILRSLDSKITSDNINSNFNKLFKYLSQGFDFENYSNNLDNVQNHPSDPDGSRKWNVKTRYHIINLVPLIFTNKNTVEFRIHTATTDFNKVLPELLINMAIIKFTETFQDRILKGDLDIIRICESLVDILDTVLDYNLSNSLVKYINERHSHRNSTTVRNGVLYDESSFKPASRYRSLFRSLKHRNNNK